MSINGNSSSSSFAEHEPLEGDWLDNFLEEDEAGSHVDDTIPLDSEAEREALEKPLLPEQRYYAERAIDLRNTLERPQGNRFVGAFNDSILQGRSSFLDENQSENTLDTTITEQDRDKLYHLEYMRRSGRSWQPIEYADVKPEKVQFTDIDGAISTFLNQPNDPMIRKQIIKEFYNFLCVYIDTPSVPELAAKLHDPESQGKPISDSYLRDLQSLGQSYSPLDEITSLTDVYTVKKPQAESRVPYYISQLLNLFQHRIVDSLTVNLLHLYKYKPALCKLVLEHPTETISIIDEATLFFVHRVESNYILSNNRITSRFLIPYLRLSDLVALGIDHTEYDLLEKSWKSLKSACLNKYVRLTGVVTTKSTRLPRLSQVTMLCRDCGAEMGPFNLSARGTITTKETVRSDQQAIAFLPKRCINETCRSSKLYISTSGTSYEDFQRITVQEPPNSVVSGQLPEKKEVLLTGDLIDKVKPGDMIVVCGVYRHIYDGKLNRRVGFPVFSTLIVANYVARVSDVFFNFTADDSAAMTRLATSLSGDELDSLFLKAMAPSIHGMQVVKQAILMALVGGISHALDGGSGQAASRFTRGDLHMLILGDPGVSKSQLLKYVQHISPKCVYTSGKGSSAAGLTVSVKKSGATGEFYLQAGALVLANGGICIIDELDKMNEIDRTALHQAMEQQTVSVAKAGIISTLEARAGIIAAANPVSGQYISSLPVTCNLNIGDALLSRFDLICVVKDMVNYETDLAMSKFIVQQHCRAHPYVGEAIDYLTMYREEIGQLEARLHVLEQDESGKEGTEALETLRNEIDQLSERYNKIVQTLTNLFGVDHTEAILGRGLVVDSDYPEFINGELSSRQVVDLILGTTGVGGDQANVGPKHDNYILPQSFLTKYIFYARTMRPQLTKECQDIISKFYTNVRQMVTTGCTPITNRQIGTLFRLAEAHARLHLRKSVTKDDGNFAIRLFSALYIPQQKGALQHGVQNKLGTICNIERDKFGAIMAVLADCVRSAQVYRETQAGSEAVSEIRITPAYLKAECEIHNVEFITGFLQSPALQRGYMLEYDTSGTVTHIIKKYTS